MIYFQCPNAQIINQLILSAERHGSVADKLRSKAEQFGGQLERPVV